VTVAVTESELQELDLYVRANQEALLRFAYGLTVGHIDEARDVVQAALEQLWRRRGRMQGIEHLDAYLRRCIVNEFLR
jgi:DNA-directed RNA polymerase specialized sigma24 family protein